MTRLLSPLACLGLLVGCAAAPEPATPIEGYVPPPALNSMRQPIRLTATAIGGDLGGAAYRVRAIEDVLLRNRADLLRDDAFSAADRPYDRLVAQYQASARTSVSVSNKAREPINPAWRRYCNGGLGMTGGDWQFVRDNGSEHGVPERLAKECVFPK